MSPASSTSTIPAKSKAHPKGKESPGTENLGKNGRNARLHQTDDSDKGQKDDDGAEHGVEGNWARPRDMSRLQPNLLIQSLLLLVALRDDTSRLPANLLMELCFDGGLCSHFLRACLCFGLRPLAVVVDVGLRSHSLT